MKKIFFVCLFLMTFLTILPAQSQPTITIVNNTGYTIWDVRLSPSDSDSWGTNRLTDNQTIPNGQSVSLQLPHALNAVNRYDIQLEDSDGDTYTKWDVLVTANARIIFTFDDFDVDGVLPVSYDGPPIMIVNNTGYDVHYVYISPSSDTSWGSDRLAANQTLPDGQSVSLNLNHPLNVTNRYDIQLEDEEGDTYTKMNVQMSANSRIVFVFDDID